MLVCVILVGCASTQGVPVSKPFPEAPIDLLTSCEPLKILNDPTTLSQLTKTVSSNYTEYFTCSTRLNGWIEWYNTQKKIYNN